MESLSLLPESQWKKWLILAGPVLSHVLHVLLHVAGVFPGNCCCDPELREEKDYRGKLRARMLGPRACKEETNGQSMTGNTKSPGVPGTAGVKPAQIATGRWLFFQEERPAWYNDKKYWVERPEFLVPILLLGNHEAGQVTSPSMYQHSP